MISFIRNSFVVAGKPEEWEWAGVGVLSLTHMNFRTGICGTTYHVVWVVPGQH